MTALHADCRGVSRDAEAQLESSRESSQWYVMDLSAGALLVGPGTRVAIRIRVFPVTIAF